MVRIQHTQKHVLPLNEENVHKYDRFVLHVFIAESMEDMEELFFSQLTWEHSQNFG